MAIGILAPTHEELGALKEDEEAFRERGFMLRVCGVGKVNAAIAVCDLAMNHKVSGVIMIGTCASLSPQINPGRMVVVTDALYHDMDARALNYALGQIPSQGVSLWTADAGFIHALSCALNDLGESPLKSRMLTGDQFIASSEAKRVIEKFSGIFVDMGTAGIAQACAAVDIPWASLCIVSNHANEKAAELVKILSNDHFETLVKVLSVMNLPRGRMPSAPSITLPAQEAQGPLYSLLDDNVPRPSSRQDDLKS